MASESNPSRPHNQSIDLYKLAAALMVVFIHVPFPGGAGRLAACVGRCAVPAFFAFAGFFSFGTKPEKLWKRMKYLLGLNLLGIALTLLAGCLTAALLGQSVPVYLAGKLPNGPRLIQWLLLEQDPFNDSLWYLLASVKCYALLWCYVRFFGKASPDYRPLYLMGAMLLALNQILGILSYAAGGEMPFSVLRTSALLGFPMFILGIFLAQYWQQIWNNFDLTPKKLLLAAFAGLAASWLEQEMLIISDMHFGSMIAVTCFLLLMSKYPQPFRSPRADNLTRRLGRWSVGIYLIHGPVLQVFEKLLSPRISAPWWPWAMPMAVAAASLLLAAVWDALRQRLVKS